MNLALNSPHTNMTILRMETHNANSDKVLSIEYLSFWDHSIWAVCQEIGSISGNQNLLYYRILIALH